MPIVMASAERMIRARSSPRCSVRVIVSPGGGSAWRSSVVTPTTPIDAAETERASALAAVAEVAGAQVAR